MTIEQAIETFVRGFTFTRSYTHPYLGERIDGVWLMRDAERKRGDYRNEEWVAHRVEPAAADAIARRHTRGRYLINAIRALDEDDAPIRREFKRLGYRLMTTEALMVNTLDRVEPLEGPLPISRVETWEQAEVLNRANRRKLMLRSHFGPDPPLRQYVAMDGELPIGWAASISAGDTRWCSNVFVNEAYRRRGIGRALLTRMLVDDRAEGALASVLLASHAGAKLYPTVGYEQIGELLMFSPPRK